ncbi:hypothetical protein LINGRAHAP2_LOCUS7723 [Linum grandiflorum]
MQTTLNGVGVYTNEETGNTYYMQGRAGMATRMQTTVTPDDLRPTQPTPLPCTQPSE